MSFDNYKFVLKTCASSENEVTGEDIELEDRLRESQRPNPEGNAKGPILVIRAPVQDFPLPPGLQLSTSIAVELDGLFPASLLVWGPV